VDVTAADEENSVEGKVEKEERRGYMSKNKERELMDVGGRIVETVEAEDAACGA